VGDLACAVDRTVRYEGTLDVLCTEMCPCQVQLFRVEVVAGTSETGAE
jgi:hypothetical protein